VKGIRAAASVLMLASVLAAAGPGHAGVQIVQSERAWAQWSGGAGCLQSFVHVLAERSAVLDPPGAPPRVSVAWVSVVKADACSGAVFESSHGRAFVRGLRIGPQSASLRATVDLQDAVSGTTRPVRVEVDWTAGSVEPVTLTDHDRGVVRITASSADAAATGSVVRDTGPAATGEAAAGGLLTFRRIAAGRDG